ncbi:hypothetical protein JTE90_027271 [Oedothorax gibbosus]|uniref:Secreted protein n=1 Tax=Oedothorax gibbosus TaxID=931172 RepID=A0AAV6VYT6_9ARAC|nr:hypothetical protein JTE90_027271 [Oedothorax gibbosus]
MLPQLASPTQTQISHSLFNPSTLAIILCSCYSTSVASNAICGAPNSEPNHHSAFQSGADDSDRADFVARRR